MVCNWGHAFANGIFVGAEDPDVFRLGAVATGAKLMIASRKLSYWKRFWFDGPRRVWIALADVPCDLKGGRGSILDEDVHDWCGRVVPF